MMPASAAFKSREPFWPLKSEKCIVADKSRCCDERWDLDAERCCSKVGKYVKRCAWSICSLLPAPSLTSGDQHAHFLNIFLFQVPGTETNFLRP